MARYKCHSRQLSYDEEAVQTRCRLVKAKDDSTAMTREEFYAKIEKGEEDYRQGKTFAMKPGESYADFRKRI
ncbi:MAG: hypothetical protein K6E45_07725 [Bacteroidaceae bacterium]|nr:hypothetical protein [Bacteroidaceae bacterium]